MSNTPQIRFAGFTDAWEQRKLGEVCQINGRIGFRGYTEKDIIPKEQGGVLAFTPTNIVNNQLTLNVRNTYITRVKYDESPEIMVKNGNILFVKTGSTLGKSALVTGFTEDSTVNPQVVVIKTDIPNQKILSTILTTDKVQSQVASVKIGGAVPTMTETELKNIELSMPINEDERIKIGAFFSKLDNIITLHQRKCDALQKFKKSMLQKMFPQNGESVPEIRFAGFTDAWEQRELSDLIEENQKPVPKPDGEYIRLGIRSHAKGTFHEVVAEGEGLDVDTMYVVEANNLIVNITFAWEEAWAITSEKDAEKLVSHRFPQYRFHQGQYPMFYQYRFRNGRMKYNLELASPGGAGRNRVLNKTEFMKIPVIIPTSYEEEK